MYPLLRMSLLSLFCVLSLALIPLQASAEQAQVDMAKLALFEEKLNGLRYSGSPVQKHIAMAIDIYLKQFSDQDSALTRDFAFILFNKQYTIIRQEIESDGYGENFLGVSVQGDSEEAYTKLFNERKKLAKSFGFILSADGEGGYRALPDAEYLVKQFGDAMPASFREYYDFMAKANNTSLDAAIAVSADTLGQIIIQGSDIIKKYPNAYITPLVKTNVARLLYAYLKGLDNSSIHDERNGKWILQKDYRAAYEKFLKADKDTYGYALVEYAYNFQKKYNFSLTKEQDMALGRHVFSELEKMGL